MRSVTVSILEVFAIRNSKPVSYTHLNLRIGRPVLLALATNDALAASAQNIGKLLNTKNVYFVPFAQDDPEKKPYSLVADFEKLLPAALAALEGRQLQPILG